MKGYRVKHLLIFALLFAVGCAKTSASNENTTEQPLTYEPPDGTAFIESTTYDFNSFGVYSADKYSYSHPSLPDMTCFYYASDKYDRYELFCEPTVAGVLNDAPSGANCTHYANGDHDYHTGGIHSTSTYVCDSPAPHLTCFYYSDGALYEEIICRNLEF